MARMTAHDTMVALRRLGLGPRPGDVRRIAGDPRGYVMAALARPSIGLLEHSDLEPSHVTFAAFREARRADRLLKARDGAVAKDGGAASKAGAAAAEPMAEKAESAEVGAMAKRAPTRAGEIRREAFRDEVVQRLARAVATDTPFLERLVMFWSNHFCVSAAKGPVRAIAGAYEREAIRPHVLGRFADMLKAVEQHPAMLIYLDNQVSIGPNSKAGRNRDKGLNENLAREILELHTLGVDGGYSQGDVTTLARMLTGWTVAQPGQAQGEAGRFHFAVNRHEPGERTLLAKRYPESGLAAGEAALADLARHPATARHLARKLAVHFLADDPPPALVSRLERAWRDSDGHLGEVAKALVAAPEVWAAPPAKVLPPYDFLVAIVRGLRVGAPPAEMLRLAALLGQPVWQPPSPKGWPDGDNAWTAPAALRERLRIAERAAREVAPGIDPRALAEDLLGPGLSERSREAIARAESREQGFELLVMAPEHVRR
jgi:uncharacterized protein (DUF1800 family)